MTAIEQFDGARLNLNLADSPRSWARVADFWQKHSVHLWLSALMLIAAHEASGFETLLSVQRPWCLHQVRIKTITKRYRIDSKGQNRKFRAPSSAGNYYDYLQLKFLKRE